MAPSVCTPIVVAGMVFVRGGKFVQGSDTTDSGAQANEQPEREVTLSPYYLDQHEVTNAAYRACETASV